MSTDRKLLEQAYAAFNARDVDAALATMDPDVIWPNGMEGDTSTATVMSETTGYANGV
jgi:hypothetical protein